MTATIMFPLKSSNLMSSPFWLVHSEGKLYTESSGNSPVKSVSLSVFKDVSSLVSSDTLLQLLKAIMQVHSPTIKINLFIIFYFTDLAHLNPKFLIEYLAFMLPLKAYLIKAA